MLHAEEQWEVELKADGKTFLEVAASFVRHLTDPTKPFMALRQPNISSALLGLDANPLIWSRYGMDLIGLTFEGSFGMSSASPEQNRNRKVSLLGGDSLYATAQWAMANLDSRACRKLIAKTIAKYSDGQLRKRELLWCTDLTIRQYLELEKFAGVATFFGASSACAALVNSVDEGIAEQMAEFGYDIGLVVALLKDTRTPSIKSALERGRMTAPIIYALERDPGLRTLLGRRMGQAGDVEDALRRIKACGLDDTLLLVNRISYRAAARLDCLQDSKEKEALITLISGMGCLPLPRADEPEAAATWHEDEQRSPDAAPSDVERRKDRFDLKIANLRLKAQLQRMQSAERESRERLDGIKDVAAGVPVVARERPAMVGLGLENNDVQVDWLIWGGLERRAPLPDDLDLDSLLRCVAGDQLEVQRRLLALGNSAESRKLQHAIREVFSAGGKRLRPALCHLVHRMLRCPLSTPRTRETEEAAGDALASEPVLELAVAIEIIHTASLIHDDILDDADTRRQRKTIHQVFGPDVAVLSGDFLFAHASGLVENLDNDQVTRLVSLVIEQFGYGELSQSAKQFDVNVTLFEYMKKSFYKTASLLAAACRASAVLSGPSREVCDMMYSYGFYLGLAFQIADDVLDFVGSGKEMGKPAAQDLREGLLTAPVILCLNGHPDLGVEPGPRAQELRQLVLSRFSRGPEDLQAAVDIVREDGGVQRAYRLADQMANKALEALTLAAPADSDARRSLAGLTRWAVRRKA
uniref:Uncharacterized protein n=1 Tax=Zooxanthella nutricula TaxID=1333877 RepID=A0A7S2PSS8_9DINO